MITNQVQLTWYTHNLCGSLYNSLTLPSCSFYFCFKNSFLWQYQISKWYQVGESKHNTLLRCKVSKDRHRNKVLCFDSPTWYHFDIWYFNRTQRGWTT